jgi:hypothetical protein
LLLDAHDTLPTFMVDGMPDPAKFRERMLQAIEDICRGRPDCTVRVFGQMVDVLWQDGQHEAAMRLEVLMNQLAQTDAFSLLYWYSVGHFYKRAHHARGVAHDKGR